MQRLTNMNLRFCFVSLTTDGYTWYESVDYLNVCHRMMLRLVVCVFLWLCVCVCDCEWMWIEVLWCVFAQQTFRLATITSYLNYVENEKQSRLGLILAWLRGKQTCRQIRKIIFFPRQTQNTKVDKMHVVAILRLFPFSMNVERMNLRL